MQFDSSMKVVAPSVLLAKVGGVLDAGSSVELELSVKSHLMDEAIRKVVMDVRDITFVSSSGLRVMMVIIKILSPRNGRLYLAGPSPQIAALVKMSGMVNWIHVKGSVRECLDDE